jgi:hypothetical protein
MDYRQSTPPQAAVHVEDYDFQLTGGSASTASTFYPHDWSPASAMTAASTPPRSPLKPRESGPLLLPRVRAQDQYMGMGPDAACLDHKRTVSLTRNDFPMQFGGHLPTPNGSERCSQSPASFSLVALPSAPISQSAAPFDLIPSQRSSMAHMRSRSASNIRAHSRNSSSSSIDACGLRSANVSNTKRNELLGSHQHAKRSGPDIPTQTANCKPASQPIQIVHGDQRTS